MLAFFRRLESVGTKLSVATAGFCLLAGGLGLHIWFQPPFLYVVLALLVIGLALGVSGWCGRKLL